jgi:hypothetical protein
VSTHDQTMDLKARMTRRFEVWPLGERELLLVSR